jgi:hypothetical protein
MTSLRECGLQGNRRRRRSNAQSHPGRPRLRDRRRHRPRDRLLRRLARLREGRRRPHGARDALGRAAIPGTPTTIALAPPPEGRPAGGGQTGICLDTTDVDADHTTLKGAGVDVDDEVSRFGGPVPPMFWLRDPDGNSLLIVQPLDG